MPFTPAHAVVAIPFVRSPLPAAAVAVGAMTPDVPLFFRVGLDYWVTHDWAGALVVDLPLALALLLVWRVVVRPAVPQLTPRWFAQRWPAAWSVAGSGWWETWGGRPAGAGVRVRAAALVLLALSIGIATHLVWDAFTHVGRWGGVLIPALDEPLGPFPLADWAHYVSSVLGLVVIAVWGIVALRRSPVVPVPAIGPRWLRVAAWTALPVCLGGAVLLVAVTRGGPGESGLRLFLERTGTTGAAIFLVTIAVLCLGITLAGARHARDAR